MKRAVIRLGTGSFIILVLIAALGGYLIANGTIKLPLGITPYQPPQSTQQPGAAAPLFVTLNDPLLAQPISSATVYILSPSGQSIATVTINQGTGISAPIATPGQNLVAKIVASGYVTRFVSFTVPSTLGSTTTCSSCVYPIMLYDVKVGTPVVKITDNLGNTWANGQTINFTTLNTQTITLTITVYNTVPNSGWISSKDVVNNQMQYFVIQTLFAASGGNMYLSVTGLQNPVQRGTQMYYSQPIADGYSDPQAVSGGFTTQTIGTQVIGGVTSFTFTVAKGALPPGATQNMTLTPFLYADPAVFASTGNYGPNAVSLTGISISFAA